MYTLQRLNVIKITDDTTKRDEYIVKGFTLLIEDTPKESKGKKKGNGVIRMLEKLKQLLGITGEDKDGLLQIVLDSVIDEIFNYCNLDELPTKLESIALKMAVKQWRIDGYGNENQPQVVKSISRGDVSTSFETNLGTTETKGVIDDYKAQLQAFRKLRR